MVMESFLILIRMVLLLFFYHLQIFQFEEINNTNLDEISLYKTKRVKLFTLTKPIKKLCIKKYRKNLLIFRTVPNRNFLLNEQHPNLKYFFKPEFSIRNT